MLNNFDICINTRFIFGKGAEKQIGEILKKDGVKKVLIHHDNGQYLYDTGLLQAVCDQLTANGIAHAELGGVLPNPRLSLVREGIELAKREGIDLVLAIGGGSVIDSAKAIGYGVYNGGDVWDFYDFKRQAEGCLPIGAVLTIAAAGSEMSGSSVITKEDGQIKRGYSSNFSRARFAVMNPELTMTLPPYQTASGCVDILMHTMERYFNQCDNMELTDGISESLMRTVMKNAKILKDEPANYDARAEVMWAGSLSHNGLTGCGTDGGDWATHKMEHEIGGLFDVAHGAGLAALWGSWARFVLDARPARFAQFATHVLGVTAGADDTETALKGIKAMEDFYHSIDMPVSLSELGVTPTPEQIRTMAEKCDISTHHNAGKVKHLSVEDMVAIYTTAL